jgi:hypothetical protein
MTNNYCLDTMRQICLAITTHAKENYSDLEWTKKSATLSPGRGIMKLTTYWRCKWIVRTDLIVNIMRQSRKGEFCILLITYVMIMPHMLEK